MGGSAETDDIRARLEAISEELADLALASLREGVETGDPGHGVRERQLSRARRAVDKAAAILGDAGPPD